MTFFILIKLLFINSFTTHFDTCVFSAHPCYTLLLFSMRLAARRSSSCSPLVSTPNEQEEVKNVKIFSFDTEEKETDVELPGLTTL